MPVSSADHRRVIEAIMLRLKTLGGWAVTDDAGVPRQVPGQRVTLLALLAAMGDRGIARDRLVALLWPERSEENARHSLGQSLYALRRDAGSAEVVLGTAVLHLNPDVVACDAWELESAFRVGDFACAVALYEGPFLDGVHLRGSAELQQLVDAQRTRLARLHADAVEVLARTSAERGDVHGAVTWWRRLAATDPLSSRVALALVQALVVSGDKTAALQAARVHETLVRDELEAEPDPTFVAYVSALRNAVPTPGSSAVAIRGAGGDERPPSAAAREPVSEPGQVDESVANDEPARADTRSTPETLTTRREATPARLMRARHDGRSVPRRVRPFLWASIATLASVALVLGAERHGASTPVLDPKRVYVAWFDNRTGDRTLDALGGMASDWVSQALEQSGVVAVASAERAEDAGMPGTAAGEWKDTPHRATDLGAGIVVSGSYYKVGDRLRFHVQISDVARGELLDSFDAEGGASDGSSEPLEAVRKRTLGGLAALVDPRLRSWMRVASKPPTYEAYREFVTGQSIWGSDHRQALAHFARAAELDTTFYAARVETAILYRLVGECARTDSIAKTLLAVRDRLAPYEYHVLDEQVALCEGDWERAYQRARAVSDLRPGSAFLEYSVALQAMQLGRYREAKSLLEHHPLPLGSAEVGPNYGMVYAIVLSGLGDDSRALDVARWVRARYPGYARGWVVQALLLARRGRTRETMALLDTMGTTPLRPQSVITNGLRRVAATLEAMGDTADAKACLTNAIAILDQRATGRTAPALDAAGRSERAQLLYERGRLDEARAALTELALADTSDVDARGHLGLIAARRGDRPGAAAVDAWLAAARPPYTFSQDLYRARMAALLGDRDRALTLLATALDRAGRFSLPSVGEIREFQPLRGDERFRRLVTLR